MINNSMIMSLEEKIKSLNQDIKTKTGMANPYVSKSALDLFSKEKAKLKVSDKIKKELTTDSKIENLLDETILMEESENRAKLYNAFRTVLRFFPELANAIRLTGEHVSNAEGVSTLPSYTISTKLNSSEIIEETNDKQILEIFLTKFKFDKEVFTKAVDLVREGDYFVEIIDLNKFQISYDSKKISDGFKILTETADFKREYKGDKLLVETASKIFSANLLNSDLDDDTKLLIEQKKIENENSDLAEKSMGNSISEDEQKRLILKKHKPENICVLTINEEVFGYVVVSSEKIKEKADEVSSIFSGIAKDRNRTENRKSKSELKKDFNDKLAKMLISGLDFNDKNAKFINKVVSSNLEIKKLIYMNIVDSKQTNVRFIPFEQMVHYKIPSVVEIDKTYGESSLYSMLPDIKDYIKLKKTLTNYLLARSVEKERVIVSVDVDGDAESAINEVVLAFKNKEAALESNLADVDSVGRQISVFDRMFLPKINGETPITVETEPQANINIDRETLRQFKNEIIAGIRTPASLMDNSENTYHTTAAQESMSYAMTILELQKIITDGDNEIIDKCLRLLGKESLTKLKYSLAPPSSLMNEILDSNIMRARTVIDFIYEMYIDDTLEEKVSYMKKLEIAKRIMPTFDWKEFDRIFEENTTSFLSTKNSKKVEQPSGGM